MYKRMNSLPEGAILLEMWSENLALKARLDAAPWLRRVQQTEFEAFLRAGWVGRGREAMLVRFFESRNDEVEILVRYAGQAGTEVCFHLDRDAAVAWIQRHRPELPVAGVSECDMAARDRPRPLRPATGAATMERLWASSLRTGSRA
jgi:hypothetical protein